jgi:hypothetical protein
VIAVLALAVALAAPGSQAGSRSLPPRVAQLDGSATAVAAAGPWLVVAWWGNGDLDCSLSVFRLPGTRAPRTVAVPGSLECLDANDATDARIDELWIGRTTLTALLSDAPSPHGVSYHLWSAPLAAGRLRSVAEWSWTDSDLADGCIVSVASGNGAIASTKDPNPLGVKYGIDDQLTCPGGAQTTVSLGDAVSARVVVDGVWSVLATDGRRVALAKLAGTGERTGEAEIVGLDGKPVATPKLSSQAVKGAARGWLTPEGLFVQTRTGVSGPTWSLATKGAVTVANGRLFYVGKGGLHVRRLADGADKLLAPKVPAGALVAAGSFGLAVVVTVAESTASGESASKTSVYRLAWRTIDRALPGK